MYQLKDPVEKEMVSEEANERVRVKSALFKEQRMRTMGERLEANLSSTKVPFALDDIVKEIVGMVAECRVVCYLKRRRENGYSGIWRSRTTE